MPSITAKKWIYANEFVGEPKATDFLLETEELPVLQNGEILVEAVFLSVDPYMRKFMHMFPIGSQMIGGQVAKIIDSKNPKFPIGEYVFGDFGWRTHTVVDPNGNRHHMTYVLPNMGSLSRSIALGAVGMPGNTAYFGLTEICQPKSGETVVVSGAAGAVGSMVGQIAKIKGCHVVGIAGSDDKCEWLKELKFDAVINYKTQNVAEQLKELAPNGVDCYFDNVGGTIANAVLKQMNNFGRIAICGTISNYNSQPIQIEDPMGDILRKQLKIEGLHSDRWTDRWMEGIVQNLKWIQSKQIKVTETITEGFENMPQAFIDMLRGGNTGKAVIKV